MHRKRIAIGPGDIAIRRRRRRCFKAELLEVLGEIRDALLDERQATDRQAQWARAKYRVEIAEENVPKGRSPQTPQEAAAKAELTQATLELDRLSRV